MNAALSDTAMRVWINEGLDPYTYDFSQMFIIIIYITQSPCWKGKGAGELCA